jgi:ferredoxin
MKYLKWVRVVLACLIALPTMLVFIDMLHLLPRNANKLLHVQLIPSLLSGFWSVIVLLTIITLLFGRIYCSVICPAGVLQDFFSRLTARGKKKNRHKRYFKYAKPNNWLRYGILIATVLALGMGSSSLLLLLDPYSNVGRVMTDLVRPALVPLTGLLAQATASMGEHAIHVVNPIGCSIVAIVVSSLFLIAIAVMSLLRGRLYCNTICPVGTFLGLFSRFAPFRVSVDHSACTHCGVCARTCKSQCIDSKNSVLDASRCVDCFNCLSSCSQDAILYRFVRSRKSTKEVGSVPKDSRRRSFLIAGATAMVTAPMLMAQSKLGISKTEPQMPPGAGTRANFNAKCTACHACVAQCPANVLEPTAFDYGIMGLMQPKMSFERGFCQFNCTHCSNICPSGALTPLSHEQKHVTQAGIAKFTQTRCVVYLEETDCGACSEHCPTQAVSMVDYVNGLRIPHVTPELCIGCGGCQYVCPAQPKAIVVHANVDQKIARSIPKGTMREHKIEGFGF